VTHRRNLTTGSSTRGAPDSQRRSAVARGSTATLGQMMKQPIFRRAVLAVLACLSFGESVAVTIGYPELSIREQFDRADFVLQARVLNVERLGKVDPQLPLGPCGVLVKVAVLEQFKGTALPTNIEFVTHRILFPEKPLKTGDVALLLLRDIALSTTRPPAIRAELQVAYANVRSCMPEGPSLYLANYEQNIFPIVRKKNNEHLWLEYERTIVPPNVVPRLESKCEAERGGACMHMESTSVAWQSIRKEIKSWHAR
jgi:hypothetical protein